MTSKRLLIGLLTLAISPTLRAADPTTAPDSTGDVLKSIRAHTDTNSTDLLGGTYQNPIAGVAFQLPAALHQVNKANEDEIARFAKDDKTWELVVTKTSSAQPMPLTGAPGGAKMGLLEVVAARIKQMNPGADIVRQDTVNLGDNEAGLIAVRVANVSTRKLLQEAIVQANDQLYYTFTLTTPAADVKGPDASDPGEQVAVETFRQMLDTIKLLDRSGIKNDQNERLFRTRALFVTLNPKKLRDTLVPEQWMRLQREGKDVGYTYIVEEPDAQGAQEGLKIGIRSRTYPDQNTQVDGETWYFVSLDRKHENWSNLIFLQNIPKKTSEQFTEFGSSDRQLKRIADNSGFIQAGEKGDPKQPPVQNIEVYSLNVQTVGKTRNPAPLTQQLPPFYLPQAVGHLLPRLLPRTQPKTYLFATYVSDQRQVMMRYVDVGNEQEVELDGQRVRAIPISDRIGLEGSPTIHYLSADGKYLGSVNKDSHITILPTDATTLQKIWANRADLSRPRTPEQPK